MYIPSLTRINKWVLFCCCLIIWMEVIVSPAEIFLNRVDVAESLRSKIATETYLEAIINQLFSSSIVISVVVKRVW